MRIRYLVLLMLVSIFGFAQKQANVWVFANGNKLDFNFNPPQHFSDGMISCSGSDFCEGVSSIADSSGQLLFYSNGKKIWGADNQVILNGDGLLGHTSSTNSAFILPFSQQEGKFYLFTTDAWENDLVNGLRYSVIDMCGENGATVTDKNILLRNSVTEKLVATRHANGVDYWLIAHEQGSAKFLAYLVSSDGVQLEDSTTVGLPHPSNVQGAVGTMKISANGDKLALTVSNTTNPGIELFDFDNSSGAISSPTFFNPDTLGGFPSSFYGLTFSPDGNILYVAPPYDNKLIQLDIFSYSSGQDIVANKYVLNNQPNIGQAFHQLQLGPDGKVYLARNSIGYLGVINNPNMIGQSCGFELQGVDLEGNVSGWGLPSFVDEFDYSANGICDSGVGITEHSTRPSVDIFPNPTTSQLNINLSANQKATTIGMLDMLGREVLRQPYSAQIDVSHLPAGNYVLGVETEEGVLRKRVVIE